MKMAQKELLKPGFSYKVIQEFYGLKPGESIRVLSSDYALFRDDGGYIIVFPDRETLNLHFGYDAEIIKNIDKYLEAEMMFDEKKARGENKKFYLELNRQTEEYNEKMLKFEKEDIQQKLDEEIKATGLSIKEAYKKLLRCEKNNRNDY
jgi:hypothetical protein